MRGQTTLDFAIGISVFLAVVLFVFTFVPGLLSPFAVSGEANTVQANQLADRLAKDELGNPDEPYVLNRYCAVEFFATGSSPPSQCRYDGSSWEERLGVSETTSVNVTLERNATVGGDTPDTLCWDENNDKVVRQGNSDCTPSTEPDVRLTMGEPLDRAEEDSTITARRVVTMHGEDMTLKVVVW